MKKFLAVFMMAFAVSIAHTQTTNPHSVTLTWTAPADATAASTVTIFRALGACNVATPPTTVLATGQSMTTPYVDSTVSIGVYCYTIQHDLNGANSANSNLAPATVSPLPVVNVTVTVK